MPAKIRRSRLTTSTEHLDSRRRKLENGRTRAPSPPGPYALVIFDFDGTLADSVTWLAGVFHEIAHRYRLKPATRAELEALRGEDALSVLATLGVARWKLPLIARHMRRLMARDMDKISLFPGSVGVLRQLSASGIKLAIVSSNSRVNVCRLLGRENVALIDHFACGASLFGKSAKFRDVLEQAAVPLARAIAIGDEVRDIEAATNVGIASGAVSWGYATRAALAARSPTVVLDRMEAIAPLVLGQAAVARA